MNLRFLASCAGVQGAEPPGRYSGALALAVDWIHRGCRVPSSLAVCGCRRRLPAKVAPRIRPPGASASAAPYAGAPRDDEWWRAPHRASARGDVSARTVAHSHPGPIPAPAEVPARRPHSDHGPGRAGTAGRGDLHPQPRPLVELGQRGPRQASVAAPPRQGTGPSRCAPLRAWSKATGGSGPAGRRVAEGAS